MADPTMKEELKWRDNQIEKLKAKLSASVERIAELEAALAESHGQRYADDPRYLPEVHPSLVKENS